MRLNEIIFPEIVAGTRGSKELSKMINFFVNSIETDDHGYLRAKFPDNLNPLQERILEETLQRGDYVIYNSVRRFLSAKGEIFYIPKSFGEALSSIKNIRTSMFPKKFAAYFVLGGDYFGGDIGYPVEGAYVLVDDDRKRTKANPITGECDNQYGYECDLLTVTVCLIGKDHAKTSAFTRVLLPDSNPLDTTGDLIDNNITALLLNAVLYVNSEDPDIIALMPTRNLSAKSKKKYLKTVPADNCTSLNIQLLNWNYHRPVQHNVEGCFVDTHMRWQPCGPNRSNVKLIWVREHERHYKNVKEATNESNTTKTDTKTILHTSQSDEACES